MKAPVKLMQKLYRHRYVCVSQLNSKMKSMYNNYYKTPTKTPLEIVTSGNLN